MPSASSDAPIDPAPSADESTSLESKMLLLAAQVERQEKEIAQLRASAGANVEHIFDGEAELTAKQQYLVDFLQNIYEYTNSRNFQLEPGESVREHLNLCYAELIGLVVMACQVIFAFAFWDANFLGLALGQYRAYADPVDVSLFRANALIGGIPTVNVVASCTSIFLLAQSLSRDTYAVLVAPQALEGFFFGPQREVMGISSKVLDSTKPFNCDLTSRHSLTMLAGSLIGFGFMTMQRVLITTQAGIGAAISFAAAGDAVDIVLNASAIAFVLDLDEMFYETQVDPDRLPTPSPAFSRLLTPSHTFSCFTRRRSIRTAG